MWKPSYKLWWNDREASKARVKVCLPTMLISALFLYMTLFNTVTLKEYALLVFGLSCFIFSIVDYHLKLPTGFLNEDDSEETKKGVRFTLFSVGLIVSYVICIPILAKYYSFFNYFLGTDFLMNHFNVN
jgi:hypothetical protein